MLAEEEATKMRLQRSAERKAQRAKDRELAGKLSAMGFDKGRISYIVSQGSGYAEGIYDLAAAASAKVTQPGPEAFSHSNVVLSSLSPKLFARPFR